MARVGHVPQQVKPVDVALVHPVQRTQDASRQLTTIVRKGTQQYNQKLSEQRALSVAQYLESKDVNPVRLATLGKGETDPIASNDTEEGRAQNRRVELVKQ